MYPTRDTRRVLLSSCCFAAASVAMFLPAGASTYTVATGTTQTVATKITGTDTVLVAGGGTLALSNTTNDYSGGSQAIGGSMLQIDSDTELGTGNLTLGDGTTTGQLVFSGATTLAASRTVTLNAGNQTINTGANTDILSSLITGTGSLVKTGSAGALILAANNTYTGNTTVANGTLQIGNGGTSGWIASSLITDNAAVAFARSDTVTFAGVIAGTGVFKQTGTGTLILTGTNTFTGGTVISSGTLQIGAGGTVGSISGAISDAGALVFNRSDAVTYSGVISGAGTLTQVGPGMLTLTGANTLTGGTTINSGTTLALAGAGAMNSSPMTINGTYDISAITAASTTTKSLAGTGTVVLGAKTMALTSSPATPFYGVVSGTGNLTVNSGTTTLAGASTYTGITTIASGATLQLGAQTSAGSIVSTTIVDNGTLTFSRSDNVAFSTVVTGTGGIKQNGVGSVLTLNAINTYTGTTTATVGTLVIGDVDHASAKVGGALSVSSSGIVAGYGTVAGNATNAGVVRAGYSSIGTLNIGGTYTQSSTGFLTAEVSPSAASLVKVTGAATLGGTFNAVFDGGSYAQSVMPILTAASVTGKFIAASGVSGDVAYSVAYAAAGNEVDIVVMPRNAAQVYSDVVTDAFNTVHNFTDFQLEHAASASCPNNRCQGWTSWAQPFFGVDHVNGEGSAAGFNSHTTGVIGGVGYRFGGGISLNAAAGYASSPLSVDNGSATASSDGVYASGLLHIPVRPVAFEVGAFYMSNTSDVARVTGSGAVATSTLRSTVRGVTGQVSYPLHGGDVVPLLRWTSAMISYGPFAEAGADVYALTGVHGSTHVSEGDLAVRVSHAYTVPGIGNVLPHLEVGAEYNPWAALQPVSAALSSTPSTVFEGIAPGTDKLSAIARLGVDAAINEHFTVQAQVSGRYGSKQQNGLLSLAASYRF